MSDTKRTVGPVTGGALGGGGAGYAAAVVIVWALAQFGVDAEPIKDALGLLLTLAGIALGGWAVKPGTGARRAAG